MKNRNDRERENSLSHDNAKRFYFAKQRQTKKKYRIAQSLKQPQKNNDNSIEIVLGTLTGGHSENRERPYERHTVNTTSITSADRPEKSAKQRQMRKAMYLRERLSQENDVSEYIYANNQDRNDDYSRYDYCSEKTEIYEDISGNADYMTNPVSSEENKDRRTDAEKRYYDKRPAVSDDPAAVQRIYRAKYIKENLERESSLSAIMAYRYDDEHDYEQADDIISPKEDICNITPNDTVESVNDVMRIGEAPVLSDDVKDNIARLIKQKHLVQRIEDRRDRYAAHKEYSQDHIKQENGQDCSDDVIFGFYRYDFGQDIPDNERLDIPDDVRKETIDADSLLFADKIHHENVSEQQEYPLPRKMESGVNAVSDNAVKYISSVKQAADSTGRSDSAQAVPYNIGMILAQNEGKKIAYQLVKGEETLAEKERSHVAERMSQSRFHFVDPESYKPKVEPRETIREEQKRKFIKNSEIKRAEVRREAEQKVKENIYVKANSKESGGIIKAIFGERVYSPKGKGVVIAGAVCAVIPVILIVIISIFVCSLFSWLAPHNESLFDNESGSYQEVDLDGNEVITGYINVIRDIFDEKQLEILAELSTLEYDHDEMDNRYIKLEESFDAECIMALAAVRKQRRLSGYDEDSEASEDIVYHLTRKDFEDIVESTFTLEYSIETRECDICEPDVITATDPETGDVTEIGTGSEVHTFLTGSGVVNISQLANNSEYFFFDQFITCGSEHYEEDRALYDFYCEVLHDYFLGTADESSHTIVDYSIGTEDRERMNQCAEIKGYTIEDDYVVKVDESSDEADD